MDDQAKLRAAKEREEAELARSKQAQTERLDENKAAHKTHEKTVGLAPSEFEEARRDLPAVNPDVPPEMVDAARQEAEYPADETDEG